MRTSTMIQGNQWLVLVCILIISLYFGNQISNEQYQSSYEAEYRTMTNVTYEIQ